MATLGNKFVDKSTIEFYCDICHYKTRHKGHYNEHLISLKHNKRKQLGNIGNKIVDKIDNKLEIENIFCKNCNKKFKTRSGLWKHNKICNIEKLSTKDKITDKDLMMALIKDNSELKNLILKVIENGTHNTTNNNTTNNTTNTHTNSHNKAFNLNFFLNETCKDAMNIMDFVDSIKLQLSDLERVGELGYVEGISNIIVKNLKELDVTQRPVHCTDKKRETMYVKDENKWEKDEEKQKLHTVVRKVTCKNQNLIPKFKEFHPDCGKYNSKFSDQYNKIIVESMGGTGDNDYEKEEKIIKNISKQVCIDKEP